MTRPSPTTMPMEEWLAYINGEPPRWFGLVAVGLYLLAITIPVVVMVFLLEESRLSERTTDAVAVLGYIPVVYLTYRPAGRAWARFGWWLRQHRRAAANLPPLEDDPRP